MMRSMLVGWTTTSKREEALSLANGAVERKLAACCQIDGPFVSVYEWKGKLENDEEFRVTFKFVSEKAAELEKWLAEEHPYENPQWIVVKAEHVAEKYLHWAQTQCN